MRHFIDVIGDIDHQQVRHEYGERFLQTRMDMGNTPGTVAKKLRHLKSLFQRAVDRGQLDENPLNRLKQPKGPKKKIRVYFDDECTRIIKVAEGFDRPRGMYWDLLIHTAIVTGMRRGELLNSTWQDIDFERKIIEVDPKDDTEHTWKWRVKDTDRRTLPLTDDLVSLLVDHQAAQPDGYPYVFVPPWRFDRIQRRRQRGNWTEEDGRCPINNFSDCFNALREKAGVPEGDFHDFRRSCLSNWMAQGLSEFEVMTLAGHSCFETTRRFYLAVREDLLQRARAASERALTVNSVARALRAPISGENEKGRQLQLLDDQ